MTINEWLDDLERKSANAFNNSYSTVTRLKHMSILSHIAECRVALRNADKISEYEKMLSKFNDIYGYTVQQAIYGGNKHD